VHPLHVVPAVALFTILELLSMVIDRFEDVTSWFTRDCCDMFTAFLAWMSWATVHELLMVTEPWAMTLPRMYDPLLQTQLPFVYTSPSLPLFPMTSRLFCMDRFWLAKMACPYGLNTGASRTDDSIVRETAVGEPTSTAVPVETMAAPSGGSAGAPGGGQAIGSPVGGYVA
jgi:hypothetical protein